MIYKPVENTCNFSHAGTFNHECGKPATHVGIFRSKRTLSGISFHGRCDDCMKITGGENAGVLRFEPIDPERHINTWKAR